MEVHGWKKSLLDIASDIHAGFNLGTPKSSQIHGFLQEFHTFPLDLFLLVVPNSKDIFITRI